MRVSSVKKVLCLLGGSRPVNSVTEWTAREWGAVCLPKMQAVSQQQIVFDLIGVGNYLPGGAMFGIFKLRDILYRLMWRWPASRNLNAVEMANVGRLTAHFLQNFVRLFIGFVSEDSPKDLCFRFIAA